MRAAKLWYKHLVISLFIACVFTISVIDSCAFTHTGIVFVSYDDDGIIVAQSQDLIAAFIAELDLGIGEEYAGNLGVHVKSMPDGTLLLAQTVLIDCILTDLGLADSTATKKSPSSDAL